MLYILLVFVAGGGICEVSRNWSNIFRQLKIDFALICNSVEIGSGHPGQPGHILSGSSWFTDYLGVTWIGSCEKRNH